MEKILAFIAVNWEELVLFVLFGIVSFVTAEKGNIRKVILQYMLMAEKKADEFALATGQSKSEFVAALAADRLKKFPKFLRAFITEEWVKKQIDKLLYQAYDYIDDGELNDSWAPEDFDELNKEMLKVYDEAKAAAPSTIKVEIK